VPQVPYRIKKNVSFKAVFRAVDKIVLLILRSMIKLYKFFLSPVLGSQCRFVPSCSDYALESVKKHSSIIAVYTMAKRLTKCHPFHPGGYDPL